MKKIFALIICMLLLSISMFAFASCSFLMPDDESSEPHTHTFGEWKRDVEPTCTEPGKDKRVCTAENCTHYELRDVPALSHDLIEHEAQEVNCSEIGWDAYVTCSRCSYTTYKEIPALTHTYVGGICKNCGQSHVHTDYSEWYGNTATCDETGYEYRDCGGCDYVDSRETGMLPHDYQDEDICINCGMPKGDSNDDDYTLPPQPFN